MTRAGSAAAPQALGRTLKRLGALTLTLSAATPASSVFVILPDVIAEAGSGALLAMAGAAVLAGWMAQVYAELASAFPLAGGEYAIVGRILGPAAGFLVLALNLSNSLLAAAVMALGAAPFFSAVVPGLNPIAAALTCLGAATALGILNLRMGAGVTGAFMAVELAVIAVLTGLGALSPQRGLAALVLHPVRWTGAALEPVQWPAIGLAAAVAIFAYDGYGSAVYFGEEMLEPRRRIGRTITLAFALVAIAEVAPLIAVLIGARDLGSALKAASPFAAFAASAAGPAVWRWMSLAVGLAIFNAVIAMVLLTARQLFAMGRDRILPPGANAALVRLHPRFASPWAATLAAGGAAGALCFVDLKLLLIMTGSGVAAIYAILCAALAQGRRTGATAGSQAPMWGAPLTPLLAAIGLVGVLASEAMDPGEGRQGLIAMAAAAAFGLGFYLLWVRPRRDFGFRAPDDLAAEASNAD